MIDVNLIGAPAFAVRVAGDDFIYAGVNQRLSDIAGLRSADMVGRSPRACLPLETAEGVLARYRDCVAAGHAVDSEVFHDLVGSGRWWHVTLTPVFGDTGAVTSLIGVATDVTDRRAAERERRESEARMALAMDVLDGGFWHLDLSTGALDLSPKLARMLNGRTADRMTWPDYIALIHPEDRERVDLFPVAREDRSDTDTAEYRMADEAGEMRWFRSRRRLIRDEAGRPEHMLGVVVDITDHKHAQAFYERQALTDPLTGLQNRRGFDASANRFVEAATRSAARFGLIVLDLDHFKPVNDRHGHATGDIVLQALAARLRRHVRPDDVVARLGGDEFAILVGGLDHDGLAALAGRLVHAARQPVSTPVGELSVGLSLGIAVWSTRDRCIDGLAARADRALYEAKLAGRGVWRMAA